MLARRLAPAVLALCGCVSALPRLTRTGDSWRLDGRPYSIAATPDGEILSPAAWTLQNFDVDRDGLHKKSRKDARDLIFGRVKDDGKLMITTRPLDAEDQLKDLRVLFDRDREAERLVLSKASSSAARQILEFREVLPPQQVGVDGAEALAVVVDLAHTGQSEVVTTDLIVVIRPLDRHWLTTLVYVNRPGQFSAGRGEVTDLIGRLHFEAAAAR